MGLISYGTTILLSGSAGWFLSSVNSAIRASRERSPENIRRVGYTVGLIAESHAYKRGLKETEIEKATAQTAAEIETIRDMLPPNTPFAVLMAPTRFEVRDDDPFSRRLRRVK